jgi:hypothetical protein
MAAFGAAVFEGQNLEHGLGLLLRIIDSERRKAGLKPLNADLDDPRTKETIGRLFRKAKDVESFSPEDLQFIKSGIEDRNYLVHSYWHDDRVTSMLTAAGRKRLVKDLDARRESCRRADRLVSRYINSYLARYGTTVKGLASQWLQRWVPDDAVVDPPLH